MPILQLLLVVFLTILLGPVVIRMGLVAIILTLVWACYFIHELCLRIYTVWQYIVNLFKRD